MWTLVLLKMGTLFILNLLSLMSLTLFVFKIKHETGKIDFVVDAVHD